MQTINKIGLGTVQFGLNYGISNQTGCVAEEEVRNILHTAWDSGVRLLDTASAYGNSEEVLGKAIDSECRFQIVTKVPKMASELMPDGVETFICQTFEQSLRKLRKQTVYSLMFHDANDLLSDWGNDAYTTVKTLKERGKIEKIGVSAYTQHQLEAVVERFDIDLVQVPVSVFDQRLVRSGYLAELHHRDIEIHARSVFLQGLLLMNPEEVPPYFEPIRPKLREFHAEAKRLGVSPLKLALTYIDGVCIISRVIVGVTLVSELREVLDALHEPALADFDRFAVNDEAMINPALWKSKP